LVRIGKIKYHLISNHKGTHFIAYFLTPFFKGITSFEMENASFTAVSQYAYIISCILLDYQTFE